MLPVAWGFLKLLSFKGRPNLGSAQLQLHRYNRSSRGSKLPKVARPNVPDVFFEWVYQKNVGWDKYPATLHVGVQGITPFEETTVTGVGPLIEFVHEFSQFTC